MYDEPHARSRSISGSLEFSVERQELLPDATAIKSLARHDRDPLAVFEASTRRGAATAATAAACLEAYSRALDPLSKDDACAKSYEDLPGKSVLHWRWQSTRQHAQDFMNKFQLNYLLTYFLLREGDEELIWRWIEADCSSTFDNPDLGPIWRKWRSFLIRELVTVKFDLASGGPADEAVQCLLDFAALKRRSRNLAVRRASFHGPMTTVSQRLSTKRYPGTNPQLCSELLRLLHRYRDAFFAGHIARLHLFHPTEPNAQPTLRLLRAFAESPGMHHLYPKTA